jgi:hypothetical protein
MTISLSITFRGPAPSTRESGSFNRDIS